MSLIKALYELPVYGVAQEQKAQLINDILNQLNIHHSSHCKEYRHLIENMGFSLTADHFSEQPYVVARLFKMLELKSIASDAVFKQLNSSGTSSQTLSKIFLDAQSAKEQSKVLAKIMQEFIGKQRLPMLLIDSPDIIKNRKAFSARGAGIQGFSFLGRSHTYALNNDMSINYAGINEFLEQFAGQKVLIFGFTYMIWQYLIQELKLQNRSLNLSSGMLFHSGGWKKLQEQAVDNQAFKHACIETLGQIDVHNFYGMVEQTGTIYVECENGHLHTPLYSDILIRDLNTLKVMENGQQGLIQLLSVLPYSYPGQSILTEDIGTIIGTDDCSCGRKGHYFHVHGRLSKSEVRGCSDTYQ